MNKYARYGSACLGGAFATAVLFTGMPHLIKPDDATPLKVTAGSSFLYSAANDSNPNDVELKTIEIDYIVPPEPPKNTEAEIEGYFENPIGLMPYYPYLEWPEFPMPTPKQPNLETPLVVINISPAPIDREAPKMPRSADASGHCTMIYNINAQGQTYDIKAKECSEYIFEKPSLRAVKQWQFLPGITDGNPNNVENVKTTIRYNLIDDQSQLIVSR